MPADERQASGERTGGDVLQSVLAVGRTLQCSARALSCRTSHHGERRRRTAQQDRQEPGPSEQPRGHEGTYNPGCKPGYCLNVPRLQNGDIKLCHTRCGLLSFFRLFPSRVATVDSSHISVKNFIFPCFYLPHILLLNIQITLPSLTRFPWLSGIKNTCKSNPYDNKLLAIKL